MSSEERVSEQKRDNGRTRRKAAEGLPPVQWFNPKPNSEDVTALNLKTAKLDEVLADLLMGLLTEDRITLKHDRQSGLWLAVLFLHSAAQDGTVPALSVRGETGHDAMLLLAYMHLVKFRNGWQASKPVESGRWGEIVG